MSVQTIKSLAAQGAGRFLTVGTSISTQSTQALNSAYAFGVSGVAFATSFFLTEAGTLTKLYVVPASYSGSWANTDGVINFEIRSGYASTQYTPGTLVASGTIALNGSTTYAWVGNEGLSISLAAGEYCIVVGDADGGATNFVTLQRDVRNTTIAPGLCSTAMLTTNGYITGSSWPQPAVIAFEVSGLTKCFAPLRSSISLAATTLARGHRIIVSADSPPLQLVVFGISAPSGSIKLYKGVGAIPNDPPFWELADPRGPISGNQMAVPYPIMDGPILRPGETYYLVWKPTDLSNQHGSIMGYANATNAILSTYSGLSCLTCAAAIEVSGGGSWAVNTDAISGDTIAFAPVAQPTICS